MALNKAVVKSIHHFLENPDDKVLHGLVVTGSIFRYLDYQEQLGVSVCDQLLQHISDYLKKLDNATLIKLYAAFGRGFISAANFSRIVSKQSVLKGKPSQRSAYF